MFYFWYNLELANWGAHAQFAVAWTRFLSSQMLCPDSQSTTLSASESLQRQIKTATEMK
jgi:hypothetical protein